MEEDAMKSTDAEITPATEPEPKAIVCLYSQDDEPFYLHLKKSLNLLERQGWVNWLEVLPGNELAATWQSDVKHADLILLLLSPDFFVDEVCYQTMQFALQERMARQVPVVPILARAVNWRLSACKNLVIVPHNEQPIASWALPDEAYASIAADLVRLVPGWLAVPSPTRPRLFQARDLPRSYVPRPQAFDEIKHLLLNQEGNHMTAITTALRGAGGFGKTTSALALCHDPEIQAAFPDGILWVELGEQPPRPLDVLNGMPCSRVSAGASRAGAPGRTTPVWPPPPVARFAACARPASQRRSRLSFHRMPCSRVSAGASRAGAPGRTTPVWPQAPAARFAACARPASQRRSRLSFHRMLASLDESLSGAITLEEARDRWRRALRNRVCLLVIDDVWQEIALEPLLEGGPQCVQLVTTRNDQVLPEDATRVWVDAMELEEAIAVLCRGLSEAIQQGAYQSTLEALARQLGYWPLLLTLANGMLGAQVRHGRG
jgi:hypothetical protein